ncbi:hypothetical protein Srubr_18590 [Streptomyces rubradiris]|uniref:TauD/TfdA-like domain-containing protein n=1 Tax=Streptomyces rubradiris TaxID=285531 RepID=A0ABQ3R835_STRRR|nr:hypothetical protein Srubr_18590 [Streptomyces rubradiris]
MHVDAILNAHPVRYIGLECLEAPDEGGETLIAGSSAFFATAPAELVETLRGIRIESTGPGSRASTWSGPAATRSWRRCRWTR